MRRHDLVYLRPDAKFGWGCQGPSKPAVRQAVGAWIAGGRPLVAARQPGDGGGVLLGLALPLSLARQRVALRVESSDVAEIRPPLSVVACLGGQPKAVRQILTTLDSVLRQADIRLGVYGSLSWETLSGEAYRHAESDIDLICDVRNEFQAEVAMTHLADAAAALPFRLDGEIRFPGGAAVAWRELAAASAEPKNQVLVKDERGVSLVPYRRLMGGMIRSGEEG